MDAVGALGDVPPLALVAPTGAVVTGRTGKTVAGAPSPVGAIGAAVTGRVTSDDVAACAVVDGDADPASAASASRRMLSGVGAGVAPACSASELFPAINRIGCPGSPFVTLVASSASCRNLVTRADALSTLVCGGPVFAALIAASNALVNFALAASVEIPSADATEDASELASFVATSAGAVPASRSCSICCCSSASIEVAAVVAVDAVVLEDVEADVPLLADVSAKIEPSS
ncbi:MAG TPA: hypothetical protein VMD91_00640 [Candidatus Sulfotelmatobacter sp.]|nr:hypothetical protein [Candidatus Sulfotelmatobacter sp.]